MRASFTRAIAAGTAVCWLSVSVPAVAGSSLMIEARPFAEKFLRLLDAGDTARAYELLNPIARAKVAPTRLSRLGAVRGSKGIVQRKYVRTKPVYSINPSTGRPSNNVIVCFVENPMASFRGVSYTAVTVSPASTPAKMQIDNFQTTSEPVSACR